MSEVGDSVDRLSPPPVFIEALEELTLLLLLAATSFCTGEDEDSLLEEDGRLLLLLLWSMVVEFEVESDDWPTLLWSLLLLTDHHNLNYFILRMCVCFFQYLKIKNKINQMNLIKIFCQLTTKMTIKTVDNYKLWGVTQALKLWLTNFCLNDIKSTH